MATYELLVTRDTTETTFVYVDAADEAEAHAKAIAVAKENTSTDLHWVVDDTPNASKDPYVTSCEQY